MIRLTIACAALSALTGCATARSYATCDNARTALILAARAIERVCTSEALSAR